MSIKNKIATKTQRREDSPRCFTSANPFCENLRAFSAKICGNFFTTLPFFRAGAGKETTENHRGFYFSRLCDNILMAMVGTVIFSSCSQQSTDPNAEYQNVDSLFLIPEPVALEKREGSFKISNDTYLTYSADLQNEGTYLNNLIDSAADFLLKQNLEAKVKSSEIELKLVNDFPPELQHGEAYRLIISPEKLQITALTTTGIMRGIQTVRQLFIPAFHSGKKRQVWYLPCLKIEDKPAFEHRGFLLDVCRHFFEKDVVFKYIDALAFYKMNILHLHLTEDQGWRIQVDKYPLLNTVSSYRTEKDGSIYGGYYSKEDLKEIVAYASERHIVVIPEIELPGHAQAALAAYPQYSCNGGPIEVANSWGVFKEIYCAGNDSTFLFLEDILTEVMEIFPSEYIHIGGDEAPKFRWEHCKKCQKRMREEGLKDEHELQSYFIQRIENFLNSKGRKLIGWDEILEGGLSENATVQSWRGMDGGLIAAQQKHYVVMSPTSHCYLDYGLDAIDLKKIYSFNPIPKNLEKKLHKYILGAECNMWTEHVPDEENLDSKVFPRLIALAEVLWSGADTTRYNDFYQRLQKHYPVLEWFEIIAGAESVPFKVKTFEKDHNCYVELADMLPGITVKYRMFETEDTTWYDYTEPILLGMSNRLALIPYKSGKLYCNPVSVDLTFHEAIFRKVSYTNKWHEYYPSIGEYALVDGMMGSTNFRDGNWQGFWGKDLDVIIDLGQAENISVVKMHFIVYPDAWIMWPDKIRLELSDDKVKWRKPEKMKIELNQNECVVSIEALIEAWRITFEEESVRYVRVIAENIGKLPPTHEAAGQDAWLFIDEIVVN